MRRIILAALIGVVWSGAAQAAGAKKPDAEYCGMGECFPEYITSITRDSSGLLTVRTRMEHYCIPGNQCDPSSPQSLKNFIHKVQCKSPGGYIEDVTPNSPATPRRIPEPEKDPPHATQTDKELWVAACSKAKRSTAGQ
jgi:hypothetical protein